MPMGFSGAPVHFSTAMTEAFKDLPFAHVFLDDLIIASKTYEEHVEHLKRVFQRLDDLHLTVALYKCQFGFRRLHYLGYEIGEDGLSMRQDKVQDIQQIESPTNVSEVR
eukprot:Nk52_evm1s1753 gene=Nk52_evmTU1s1753